MRVYRHAFVLSFVLATFSWFGHAITETEDEIVMRDAGATKDRPRIEAYDMDEETQ